MNPGHASAHLIGHSLGERENCPDRAVVAVGGGLGRVVPRESRTSVMLSHDDNNTRFCLKSEMETTGHFFTL